MGDDFYDRTKDRETVISTDRTPIRIYTPDGRVLVVERNRVGFKPENVGRGERQKK